MITLKSKMCTLLFQFSIFLTGNMPDVCLINLQPSPKILETPMHDPFPLQQHRQRDGGGGGLKGSKIFQSVLRFLSEIVVWLP